MHFSVKLAVRLFFYSVFGGKKCKLNLLYFGWPFVEGKNEIAGFMNSTGDSSITFIKFDGRVQKEAVIKSVAGHWSEKV